MNKISNDSINKSLKEVEKKFQKKFDQIKINGGI